MDGRIRAAGRFLDASVVAGLNILVAGGTQAGCKQVFARQKRAKEIARGCPHGLL